MSADSMAPMDVRSSVGMILNYAISMFKNYRRELQKFCYDKNYDDICNDENDDNRY